MFAILSTAGCAPQLRAPAHSSDRPLVYAKPCQCRAHRVDRAEDNDPVTRDGRSLRGSTALFHRVCKRDPLRWQPEPLGEIRGSAATRPR